MSVHGDTCSCLTCDLGRIAAARAEERAVIVAWLRREAAELGAKAQLVPLGRVYDGGPLHDTPIYSVIAKQVAALRVTADAIERGEHEEARRG